MTDSSEGKKFKILIVDDEVEVGEAFQSLINDTYDEIESVYLNSSVAALEKLKCDEFDLIITDIVMPEMNGIELTKEAKKLYPGVKIIVMSGGGPDSQHDIIKQVLMDAAVDFGAIQSIAKPFSWEDLRESIERALNL